MKSLFLMIAAALSLFLSTQAGAQWQSRSHQSHDDVVLLVQYAAQAYDYSRHNGGQLYYDNRNYRDRRYGNQHRSYRHYRYHESDRYGHQRNYHDRYHHDRRHNRRHDRYNHYR